MRHQLYVVAASILACAPTITSAEIVTSSDAGFVSHNEVLVRGSPADAWDLLVDPAAWWNGDHSYSGDTANMSLSPHAGGCFCETIPGPQAGRDGHVEHMRVIYAVPESTLRLSGALGPLQSEALTGILTITLEAEGEMTRINWDYVVGG